jgi:hypothetical protein
MQYWKAMFFLKHVKCTVKQVVMICQVWLWLYIS